MKDEVNERTLPSGGGGNISAAAVPGLRHRSVSRDRLSSTEPERRPRWSAGLEFRSHSPALPHNGASPAPLCSIRLRCLLLGMVYRASRLAANFPHFALIDGVGNDCFGGVLARLELRPLRFLWGVGLFFPDFDVFVARNRLRALRLLLVGRADGQAPAWRQPWPLRKPPASRHNNSGRVQTSESPLRSAKSSLLCPVRFGQSRQLPALGTS
jgi:hypothetical protein